MSNSQEIFDPKADSPLSDSVLQAKKDRYALFDTESAVTLITRQALGIGVKKIEPLGVGANAFDHVVFRVYVDDGRVLVCRINTDTLVADHFTVEAALYAAWHRNGIPSPHVYTVTLREQEDGFDSMLLENVGTSDLEKHLVQHSEDEIWYARASGAFLAGLHVVPVSGFGMLTLRNGELMGQQATWREALSVRLEDTMTYLIQQQLLSREQGDEVRAAITRNETLLQIPRGVTLHGDYHHANILIDEGQKKVVAAVDLSQAKAGDPLYDIAFYGTYVSPETFAAFCDGYFSLTKRPDDLKRRLALYQLRIFLSKAKLRKRFGYEARIPAAIDGVVRSLTQLN